MTEPRRLLLAFAIRFLTTIVALPAVVLIIWQGGASLLALLCVVSLLAMREFYHALDGKNMPQHWLGYAATPLCFALLWFTPYAFLGGTIVVLILAQMSLSVLFKRLTIGQISSVVYGFLLIPAMVSFIYMLRGHDMGLYYVWFIFICAFGCDSFAYMGGQVFGRTKLVNSASPGKTVEGFLCGIVCAMALGLLFSLWLDKTEAVAFNLAFTLAISFVGAVFSIFGDMSASAIKRQTGIKDFGRFLPGHGGAMDRLDSIVLVAPAIYIFVEVFG